MDFGDWIFVGVAVISGIASLTKAAKKKTDAQSSGRQTSTEDAAGADDWLKNILRETTKGMFDTEDEYIPKNEPQPKMVREQPVEPPSKKDVRQSARTGMDTRANAETFRRTNQSLEGYSRSHVSLEDSKVVEGDVKHTGVHPSMSNDRTGMVAESALLDPAEDFSDMAEVRKAIIYGEILRPKF